MWLWRGCSGAGCDEQSQHLPRHHSLAAHVPLSAVGHQGLAKPGWRHSKTLGKAVAVLVVELEGLGGDTQAVPPSCARPGAPWCLLGHSVCSEPPGEGLVLLLQRHLGAGESRAALPAPHLLPPPAHGAALCWAGSAAGISLGLWALEPAQASLLGAMGQRGG